MKMYFAVVVSLVTLILSICVLGQHFESVPLPVNNGFEFADGRQDLPAAAIDDASLSAIVSDVAGKEKITGMVALVMVNREPVAKAAFGLRNANQPDIPLTVDDKMHLGSCTKAITATLAGLLVDQGRLSWEDTIASRLPQIAEKIAFEYRNVTLSQLLQHRGGVIANGTAWQNGGVGTFENRLEIIAMGLEKVPAGLEIDRFHYSNLGYVIIGAMTEAAGKEKYEKLVQSMIFDPLEMKSAGFGPPNGDKPFDQPRGHTNQDGKITPLNFDNPPSMSPAGRVHANLADWARFIAVHMPVKSEVRPGFLSDESLKFLHSSDMNSKPSPLERLYAGGWLIVNAGSDELELQHEGSNTLWLATVIVQPHKGNAILVATNHPLELSQKANSLVVDRVRQAIK